MMREVEIIWPSGDQFTKDEYETYVDIHRLMERCALRTTAAIADGRRCRPIALNSRHGLGKTLMVTTLAALLRTEMKMKVPLITLECNQDVRKSHLEGTTALYSDNVSAFVPGPIPLAIELANEHGFSILCLEEISALTPGAQKALNSCTDHRKSMFVPHIGKEVRLRKDANILVIGTMNPSSVYSGVFALNPDLRSRFIEEVVPYPNMQQEIEILKTVCPWVDQDLLQQVVQLGKDSRTEVTEFQLSTRDLRNVLEEFRDIGAQFKEDVLVCVANKFESQEQDIIIDKIDGIFKTKLKKRMAA